VYYWLRGASLRPVHFAPYAQANRLEEYYDEGEQKVKLRVKHTYSPVLRNVNLGEPVAITDLRPVTRRAIRLGKFALPGAQLWSIPANQGKSSQDSLLTSASEAEGGH